MTDKLRKFLNSRIELIKTEQYWQLQYECPSSVIKELKLLLLECSGHDTDIIVQNGPIEVLQYQLNKNKVDAFVIDIVMYNPSSPEEEPDRYIGDFKYTVFMNNKIHEGIFTYDVVVTELPRATRVLEQCGDKFAEHLESLR